MEIIAPPPVGKCVQHPYLHGVGRCSLCRAWVCATCDFGQPNGEHVCPECAVKSGTEATGSQRILVIWAYVAAVWSTAMFLALFLGVFAGLFAGEDGIGMRVLDMFITWAILGPAVAGVGLAAGAERRRYKPMSIAIAFYWNWLLIAGIVVLSVIGSLS